MLGEGLQRKAGKGGRDKGIETLHAVSVQKELATCGLGTESPTAKAEVRRLETSHAMSVLKRRAFGGTPK